MQRRQNQTYLDYMRLHNITWGYLHEGKDIVNLSLSAIRPRVATRTTGLRGDELLHSFSNLRCKSPRLLPALNEEPPFAT